MKNFFLKLFVLINVLCFAICSKLKLTNGFDDNFKSDKLVVIENPQLKSLFSGFNNLIEQEKKPILQPRFLEKKQQDETLDDKQSLIKTLNQQIEIELKKQREKEKQNNEEQIININKNQKFTFGDEILFGSELLEMIIFSRELKKAICGENAEFCDLSFLQEIKKLLEEKKNKKGKEYNGLRFIETESEFEMPKKKIENYKNVIDYNKNINTNFENVNNNNENFKENNGNINSNNKNSMNINSNSNYGNNENINKNYRNNENINRNYGNNENINSNYNENINRNNEKSNENLIYNSKNGDYSFENQKTIQNNEISQKQQEIQEKNNNIQKSNVNNNQYELSEKDILYKNLIGNRIDKDVLKKLNENIENDKISPPPKDEKFTYNDIIKNLNEDALKKINSNLKKEPEISKEINENSSNNNNDSNNNEMDELVNDIINGKNVKLNDHLSLNDNSGEYYDDGGY